MTMARKEPLFFYCPQCPEQIFDTADECRAHVRRAHPDLFSVDAQGPPDSAAPEDEGPCASAGSRRADSGPANGPRARPAPRAPEAASHHNGHQKDPVGPADLKMAEEGSSLGHLPPRRRTPPNLPMGMMDVERKPARTRRWAVRLSVAAVAFTLLIVVIVSFMLPVAEVVGIEPCEDKVKERCHRQCCPGGTGGPVCGARDCTLDANNLTWTCAGLWMKENCPVSCGLCTAVASPLRPSLAEASSPPMRPLRMFSKAGFASKLSAGEGAARPMPRTPAGTATSVPPTPAGTAEASSCADAAGERRCRDSVSCCPGGIGSAACSTMDCVRLGGSTNYSCPGAWMIKNCARTCGLCKPCETSDSAACTGSEMCCPGAAGGPMCGSFDCKPGTDGRAYVCTGSWMKENCAHLCGLCGSALMSST
mmetsp:Transcript_31229/g.85705  ORF Transcript_31229/g.85705 Transcript_31229/m.85705 type:complete len:422 (+) Transcript_31229:34-1299(+)